MRGHRLRLSLTQALEEAALESKFSHAFILFDNGRHFKQTIGFTDFLNTRRATATNNNTVRGLFDHFKVVCYQGAAIIRGGLQLGVGPELIGRFWPLVLASQVSALEGISYRSTCQ